MRNVKKSLLNLRSKPLKSLLLVLIFLLFGVSIFTVVLINSSMGNADALNSYEEMAKVTVNFDFETAIQEGRPWDFQEVRDLIYEFPTFEDLELIGQLPYVANFNIITTTSDNVFGNYNNAIPEIERENLLPRIFNSVNERFDGNFNLRGVTNFDLENENSFSRIIEGRTFTDQEIMIGKNVVIVSKQFAVANNLNIGDIISVYSRLNNFQLNEQKRLQYGNTDDNALFYWSRYDLELEIIGIWESNYAFDAIYEERTQQDLMLFTVFEKYNTLTVPFSVAYNVETIWSNEEVKMREWNRENIENHFEPSFGYGFAPIISATFTLYNSRDIDSFKNQADEMLPDLWYIRQ